VSGDPPGGPGNVVDRVLVVGLGPGEVAVAEADEYPEADTGDLGRDGQPRYALAISDLTSCSVSAARNSARRSSSSCLFVPTLPLGGSGTDDMRPRLSTDLAMPPVPLSITPTSLAGDVCTAIPRLLHPGRLGLCSPHLCLIACYVHGDGRPDDDDSPLRLKVLLRERHWQTYRTFSTEYDKAARKVDPSLVGAGPSRAQLHRWTSGQVRGLPYPDHCRVLEKMFPGWTAEQLFEQVSEDQAEHPPAADRPASTDKAAELLTTIDQNLHAPQGDVEWGPPAESPASVVAGLAALCQGGQRHGPLDSGVNCLSCNAVLRLSDDEAAQLANLSGNIVGLSMSIEIDIDPEGWSRLTYRHQLLNLSDKPMARLSREVWFENTRDRLSIEPISDPDRRVMIQRIHDTANLSTFACQISPAIQPGETATVGRVCEGGQFLNDHYWQLIARYTRHYTLRVRHQQARQLLRCWATEEEPNGSESSAEDALVWDYDGGDVVMTLTRDHLRPNQALTLRWDVPHEPA